MGDTYHLQRFIDAQDSGGTWERAIDELTAGRKVGHWMWFVFPQVAGLGMSSMSREYAITSLDEARAHLRHPLLGPRLIAGATVVGSVTGRTAEQIFGGIDAVKLRSSLTLFDRAAETGGATDATVFRRLLDQYFGGEPDQATLDRI